MHFRPKPKKRAHNKSNYSNSTHTKCDFTVLTVCSLCFCLRVSEKVQHVIWKYEKIISRAQNKRIVYKHITHNIQIADFFYCTVTNAARSHVQESAF